jgi:hypothetical protein
MTAPSEIAPNSVVWGGNIGTQLFSYLSKSNSNRLVYLYNVHFNKYNIGLQIEDLD